MVEPVQYLAKACNFGPKQRGALVQTFLRLLLGYTSLPGYFGVDEEESDLTLPFWYIFQEALWSIEPGGDDDAGLTRAASTASNGLSMHEQQQMDVAKAVYAECVRVLRRKVVWPNRETLKIWPKGMIHRCRSSLCTYVSGRREGQIQNAGGFLPVLRLKLTVPQVSA
jgi:hypothetical protein